MQRKSNKARRRIKYFGVFIFVGILILLMAGQCGGKPPATPSFSLTATPVTIEKQTASSGNLQPQAGPTGSSTITISKENGFSGNVHLSIPDLPPFLAAGFNPNDTKGSTSSLTLELVANPTLGEHNIVVKGTSGNITATTVLKLTIIEKPDTVKPRVVKVRPANGSSGIKEDAKISIEFSEKMNKSSVEKAWDSRTIGEVSFAWSADGKTITITPKNKLKYSPNTSYKYYVFKMTTDAQDLAGNALDKQKHVMFSTFRTLEQRLISEPNLDGQVWSGGLVDTDSKYFYTGDWDDNSYVHAYLSFDLNKLPKNVLKILSANLGVYHNKTEGTPYKDLKDEKGVVIFHVNYGLVLDEKDFDTKPLSNWLMVLSDKAGVGRRIKDVTSRVQDDLVNRNKRNDRSQYMLQFARNTDNGDDIDTVEFFSANNKEKKPYLELSYLAP